MHSWKLLLLQIITNEEILQSAQSLTCDGGGGGGPPGKTLLMEIQREFVKLSTFHRSDYIASFPA